MADPDHPSDAFFLIVADLDSRPVLRRGSDVR